MDDEIEIKLTVSRGEVENLTIHQRATLIGERGVSQINAAIALPPDRAPWKGRYTEEQIRQAFERWGKANDGFGPRKKDWSKERDPGPDHIWPRAEQVVRLAHKLSPKYGIRTEPNAPHKRDAQQRELWWNQEPGYCVECFMGSGCQERQMGGWQFAVEVIGGLQLPPTTDSNRSRRDQYGRNRQMVTGGRADVHLHRSDPAATGIIETIDPSR